MLYTPVKVDVPSRFHEKIQKSVEKGGKSPVSVTLNLTTEGGGNNHTLLLTQENGNGTSTFNWKKENYYSHESTTSKRKR